MLVYICRYRECYKVKSFGLNEQKSFVIQLGATKYYKEVNQPLNHKTK